MSRIGKLPVVVPSGVNVSLERGVFTAKGSLGELKVNVHRDLAVLRGREIVQLDLRVLVRVRRLDAHPASRARTQVAHARRDRGVGM